MVLIIEETVLSLLLVYFSFPESIRLNGLLQNLTRHRVLFNIT